MSHRLWGVPFVLIGLFYVLMSRDRLEREAERGAREAGRAFPWMSARRVRAEGRSQYVLLRIVPPLFVLFGTLVLLGVLDLEKA